jgi:prevent-host-death family protein
MREPAMPIVSLYDAKTHLSGLVDRAAAGEEIIISKNGAPKARLVAFGSREGRRKPAGALGLTYIAEEFDAPDEIVDAMFRGA